MKVTKLMKFYWQKSSWMWPI